MLIDIILLLLFQSSYYTIIEDAKHEETYCNGRQPAGVSARDGWIFYHCTLFTLKYIIYPCTIFIVLLRYYVWYFLCIWGVFVLSLLCLFVTFVSLFFYYSYTLCFFFGFVIFFLSFFFFLIKHQTHTFGQGERSYLLNDIYIQYILAQNGFIYLLLFRFDEYMYLFSAYICVLFVVCTLPSGIRSTF
eukprot:177601_1